MHHATERHCRGSAAHMPHRSRAPRPAAKPHPAIRSIRSKRIAASIPSAAAPAHDADHALHRQATAATAHHPSSQLPAASASAPALPTHPNQLRPPHHARGCAVTKIDRAPAQQNADAHPLSLKIRPDLPPTSAATCWDAPPACLPHSATKASAHLYFCFSYQIYANPTITEKRDKSTCSGPNQYFPRNTRFLPLKGKESRVSRWKTGWPT